MRDELRLAADISWSVSEKASLHVTGGFDEIEAQQACQWTGGLAAKPRPADVLADVKSQMYDPRHSPYV